MRTYVFYLTAAADSILHAEAVKVASFEISVKGSGPRGPRGFSTYELAQQDGFTGTYEEWVDHITGEYTSIAMGHAHAAQTARIGAETAEQAASQSADDALNASLSAEADRVQTGLDVIAAAGSAAEAHTERVAAETAKGQAETARDNAFSHRQAAQDAQVASESARDTANTAASNASASAGQAEASNIKAQAWAENPVDEAVEVGQYSAKHHATKARGHADASAQSASDSATAQGIAETKANEASASASAAEDSEVAAGLSAAQAANSAATANTHAQNALSSANASALSANAAQGFADDAEDAANAAELSEQSAAGSASEAETSANTATAQAGNAAASASTAEGHANTASTQAGIATTQASIATAQAGVATSAASAASDSADAAAGSASDAHDSEVAAQTSATIASTQASQAAGSASAAADSASAAATSAGQASDSAGLAEASKTAAALSETNAGISANTAEGFAEDAEGYANAAASSAGAAAGSASSASTHATNASNSASDAADSAGAASGSASAAAESATTAGTHASTAGTHASNAAGSAAAASTSESNAAGSATAAANSASAASTSATSAATSAGEAEGYRDETQLLKDDVESIAQSIAGGMFFAGDWDASGGTFPPAPTEGSSFWKVSVEGTLSGRVAHVGDTLIYNNHNSSWIHLDTQDQVVSVNGKTGAVELSTTDILEGTRLYFTAARAVSAIKADGAWKAAQWDQAFGWGNHASEGYLKAVTWASVTGKPSTFPPSAHNHDGVYEPAFSKATAFNRDFGSTANTVTQGNDPRLSNAREWTATVVTQAEAESGTATTARKWTAQRVRQAILAWWNGATSAWGRGLVNSANSAAGRTALGLGTAATSNVTVSGTDRSTNRLPKWGDEALIQNCVVAARMQNITTQGYAVITLPVAANSSYMLSFKVRVYSSYNHEEYDFSGYAYSSTNNWHAAKVLGNCLSSRSASDFAMGRNADGKLYVVVPVGQYAGVSIHDITVGYNIGLASADWSINFTTTKPSENAVSLVFSRTFHSDNFDPNTKANTSTQVIAGTGLSGGGNLSANRTLSVNYGTAAGTAAQGNDSRIVNAVPNSRQIIAGTGLTGGGNLTANRTLSVNFGTTAGTVAQGNDSRIVGALQTSGGTVTGSLAVNGALTVNGSANYLRGVVGGNNNWFVGKGAAGSDNISLSSYILATNIALNASGMVCNKNITAYSDERLKKNWKPLPSDFIEEFSKVKSGIYDRTDVDITQVGVSAQSLKEVMPEAVTENDTRDEEGNGYKDALSVSYGNAALVAAVELAKAYVALKEEVKALREEVAALKGGR